MAKIRSDCIEALKYIIEKKLQSPWPLVQQKKSVLFHNDIQKRANYIVRKVINTKKSFSFRYYPNHLEKRWLGKAGSTWISQPCLHVEKLLTSKSTLQDSVYIVYLQGAGGIFGPAGQTRSAVGFMNGSELVPRNEIPIFSCWKLQLHKIFYSLLLVFCPLLSVLTNVTLSSNNAMCPYVGIWVCDGPKTPSWMGVALVVV